MSDKFAKDVITQLNKFRSNPKYIQHQCEIVRTGFSRLKATDSFLNEIDSFIKEINSLKPLRTLEPNPDLTEAAKNELPNFRGSEKYQKYKKNAALKGIVPDYYLVEHAALCADDGAEEPINVLTKVLLNKLDKSKEGRKILCDPTFTQVGVAHEEFNQENMVIMIFATKPVQPVKKSQNEFLKNIQYRETKDIKNPKYEAGVHHRIKGDIFGDFGKIEYESQMFSHGESRPRLEKPAPQQLRGNKSELKMTTKTTTTTKATRTPANPRERNPVTATAKAEKIQNTRVGRRNEGTSVKTETKVQSKTTTTGLRGKPNDSSTTTKTTKRTTVEKPAKEVKKTEQSKTVTTTTKTTTTTTTKSVRGGDKGADTKGGDASGSSVRQKYAKRKFGK